MKKKNISQDNQLQEFIMQIIDRKNDSEPSDARRYFNINIKESI